MMKQAPPPSRYGRLRRLSAEEIELWLHVTRDVLPQPGQIAPASIPGGTAPVPAAEPSEDAVPAEPSEPVKKSVAPRSAVPSLNMLDRRLRQKLARGQMPVDAVIDLHGMRQQEAHAALHGFLQQAQRAGAKMILVVTGKGEGRDAFSTEGGVLRRSVPHWLRAADWRSLVVGFEEASRLHGGAGALYVRLRRPDRTKGQRRGA